jgi:8-oxo-dGTP pyrophosphatase MutT (NUDIX family)
MPNLPTDRDLIWELLEVESSNDFKAFSVRRQRAIRRASGHETVFSIIDCPDWANVVAITPDDRMLFVRQYRPAVDQVTLEIPGGLVDPGECPDEAARRELEEETGFVSSRWEKLGELHPNPALQNNRIHSYLALGCEPRGTLSPDEGEFLALEALSLTEVRERIRAGEITHALVIAALFWLDQRGTVAGAR